MSEKSWICQSLHYYQTSNYFDPHGVYHYSKYDHYNYYHYNCLKYLTVALMMTIMIMTFTTPTLGGNKKIPNT